MNPQKPIDMIAESKAPEAVKFVKEMTTMISRAWENIIKAQSRMKIQADKHCRDHTFQIRDKVMLHTQNLNLPTSHSQKLSPKWVGPFMIIRQKHKDSFKLDLQGRFKVHLVFHVNLLKPWIDSDESEFPNHHQDPPSPVIINNQEEFVVHSIVNKRTRYGKTEYLVTWEGYRPEDSTWEPLGNLQNAQELIDEFNSQKDPRRVQVIRVKEAMPPWNDSGQNHFKKGDEDKKTTTASQQQKSSTNNPNMKVEHNNRFPREEQIPYHHAERWSEAADMGQAEEI